MYTPLAIPDVVLMEPKVFGDHRGFFMETFRQDEFDKNVVPACFVQDNHSSSVQGTLRDFITRSDTPRANWSG